ncbi:LacI family DNA-binding transcriptional regulator [Cellulomonas soli]
MATIGDVAREAGVSVSTVSYVLSGKRSISGPTRERVERAVDALGYRPHAGARALASSRSNVLALMVPFRPGINVQIIMQFVGGVVTTARQHDHDVLVLTQDDPSGIPRVAASSTADALIVMDIESDDARLPGLRALDMPAILIGVPDDTTGLSCVDLDFTAAGRLAVRELARAGHTHLALIGASQDRLDHRANYAVRMRQGVREQAAASGVALVEVPCEPTFADGARTVGALLREHPEVTGLVVHNEAALGGILARVHNDGLRVPQDLSVIAVSPSDIAAALPVPVSTIEVPGHRIGRIAVEMAMARLAGDDLAETRLVAPTFTDRSSIAAAPAPPAPSEDDPGQPTSV